MRRKKEEGRRKKKEKSTKIFLISNDLRPIPHSQLLFNLLINRERFNNFLKSFFYLWPAFFGSGNVKGKKFAAADCYTR